MTRPRRWAMVAATAGLVLGPAIAASAHARVVRSHPADGATVKPPSRVSVAFDDPVTLVPAALRVLTDRGRPVAVAPAHVVGGTLLTARVRDHLAAGHYHVTWRIRSDDGHIESSTFSFAVAGGGVSPGYATAADPPATPPAAPGEPTWPVVVAAALAVLAGLGAALVVRRGLQALGGSAAYPPEPTAPRTPEAQFRH